MIHNHFSQNKPPQIFMYHNQQNSLRNSFIHQSNSLVFKQNSTPNQSLDSTSIYTFTSEIMFKVNKGENLNPMIFTEILNKNYAPLYIPQNYNTLFISQFSQICFLSFNSINLNSFTETIQRRPQLEINQFQIQDFNLTQFQIIPIIQNQILKIYLQQRTQTGNINAKYEILNALFINFLSLISRPVEKLLRKYGVMNKSFLQRVKTNKLITKQKKNFKNLIKTQQIKLQLSDKNQMEIEKNQSKKNGIIEQIQVISQITLNLQEQAEKRGGYFVIQKKQFTIIKQNQTIQNRTIAEKRLSQRKRLGTIYRYEDKIPKEITLIQHLNNLSIYQASFFAQYYSIRKFNMLEMNHQNGNRMEEEIAYNSDQTSKKSFSTKESVTNGNSQYQQAIYMDYYDENLEEYLIRNGKLNFYEIVPLLKQIFMSVQILHRSGIIHRDIKPGNFMLQKTKQGSLRTKLIDYGQSTHQDFEYTSDSHLGFSTNYAPIQCTFSCKQGFNAKQIDLWSIGVMIYRLVKNRFPLTYSKCFKNDIKTGWPTELNFCLVQNGRGRFSILQNMLLILSTLFMKVKPRDRLNIAAGINILNRVQQLTKQLTSQIYL